MASARAVDSAMPRSSGVWATFMPRPPPPAVALISTGKPIALAIFIASGSLATAPSEPGTTGNAELLGRLLRLDLVAHDADVLRRRADEGDLVLFEDLGEAGVLRQEAVAGMHGVGAGDLAGGQQARNIEIAFGGGRRPDAHALVGKADVHGVGVRGRMHGDGGDAELLARALDAQCNLSPVGDQDFVEHSFPASSE